MRELDFQFLVADTTLLRGGVQYLDATYDSFTYNQVDLSPATAPPNFLTPVTGCASTQVINSAGRSFDIDCSGKRALFAPKWTLSLGLQQTIELNGLDLVAAVDGRYRSNRELGFNYLPNGASGEDLTVDASVNFEFDAGFTVSVFGRNLTDEAVHSTYQIGSANVTARTYEPPRTYGVRVAYDF